METPDSSLFNPSVIIVSNNSLTMCVPGKGRINTLKLSFVSFIRDFMKEYKKII